MRAPFGRDFVCNSLTVVLFRAALWTGLIFLLPKMLRDAFAVRATDQIRAAWDKRRGGRPNRALDAVSACLLVVVMLLTSGCSVALEGKARASLFAPLNREVKQSADSAIAEAQIVGALIVEAGGEPFLAEAYLKSRGYSDAQVGERIAIARARGATAAARMSKQ